MQWRSPPPNFAATALRRAKVHSVPAPVIATLVASLLIVFIHRVLAWPRVRSPWLESLVVGDERKVFKDGQFDSRQTALRLR
jgi:uncharacterized membrane protein YcaP (DUF421 family)